MGAKLKARDVELVAVPIVDKPGEYSCAPTFRIAVPYVYRGGIRGGFTVGIDVAEGIDQTGVHLSEIAEWNEDTERRLQTAIREMRNDLDREVRKLYGL